ncbi:MAG: PaaI family thioesterase [Daejeonella sp.]|uniref:PaaI family thioesterase n=1 Tax=Daejeonella sp. TaxID=2805397 RepID=UPI002736B376|nr:PaaI family thioesterase [Daejeonella sp.]MDP3469991.1 PaaI family thioesterase [Daejeonella sp.]
MNEINPHLAAIQQEIGKEFSNSPSPFTHWLKPIIRSAESGALIFEYLVRKDMTNPMQVLHGGVSAGIIDDIIGATVFTMNLSHHYTTINNYIDYFASAREGDIIEARSSVVKRGKQIINLQCELWLPIKNRLIARGYSNMIRLEQV